MTPPDGYADRLASFHRQNLLTRLILPVAIVWTVLAYWQGLSGAFIFDDHPNITGNGMVTLNSFTLDELTRVWNSGIASPLGRPIAMLSFGLNTYFFGMDPWWFKAVNLAIHITTGLVLFWLVHLISRGIRVVYGIRFPHWLPAIIAAFWLIHPYNLSPVLYVVQRMAGLAALFMVLALALYALGRLKLLAGKNGLPWILAGFIGGTLLATGSKEIGLLIPWLIVAVEWFVFRFETRKPIHRIILRYITRVLVVAPLLGALGFALLRPEWLVQGYETRDFDALERLMTQARLMWIYLGQTVVPNVASMGLFHDDLEISRGLFTPWTTVFAIFGLAIGGLGALLIRNQAPLFGLGIVMFLIAHSMEAGPIALEMVHEHRNYFASMGALIAFMGGLTQPAVSHRLVRIIPLMIGILFVLYATALWIRAEIWGDHSRLLVSQVLNHPESARSRYELGRFYALLYSSHPEKPEALFGTALKTLREAGELDPDSVAAPAAIVLLHWFGGKPVDAASIEAIREVMARSSHIAISPTTMGTLLNCGRKPGCPLKRDDISAILLAALSNPKLVDHTKAQWLSLHARFLVEAHREYDRGIELLTEAVELAPHDPRHKHNLIHSLVLTGKFAEAHQTIERFERTGELDAIRGSTERLKQFIRSVENENLTTHEINRRWLEFSRGHSGPERIAPLGNNPSENQGTQPDG